MSEALLTFHQKTSMDLPNATSLPGSADGATRSDSPEFQTAFRFGLVPAHASLSARQGNRKARKTTAISGHRSPGLLTAADLQRSLASKLQARLGAIGSPEYSLTWKTWTIGQREPICALRAAALPTYVRAYGGVPPTPTARDYRHGMSPENLRRRQLHPRGVNLNEFMQRALGRSGKLNPMFACLLDGVPNRVGQVRGFGNAIVPEVAAQFIEAFIESIG
jgi:hypothetical protein